MAHSVVTEHEMKFEVVEWGQTKSIFGPENVGSRNVRINITEYAPGTEHKLHKHPRQEEIIYVLEGNGISRTKEGDKPISPGSFVYVPANTDHATINLQKNKPMKAIIIKAPPEG